MKKKFWFIVKRFLCDDGDLAIDLAVDTAEEAQKELRRRWDGMVKAGVDLPDRFYAIHTSVDGFGIPDYNDIDAVVNL